MTEILSEKRGWRLTPPRGESSDKPQEPRDGNKLVRSHRIESSMIKNLQNEILEPKIKLKKRELKIESLRDELEKVHSSEF